MLFILAGLDELACYLAEYLGTYGEDPLESEEHVQQANAVLWAAGRERWRPSNGVQSYMATNWGDPSMAWELIGIGDGTGDLHEVGGSGTGVTKLETYTPRDRWRPLKGVDPGG